MTYYPPMAFQLNFPMCTLQRFMWDMTFHESDSMLAKKPSATDASFLTRDFFHLIVLEGWKLDFKKIVSFTPSKIPLGSKGSNMENTIEQRTCFHATNHKCGSIWVQCKGKHQSPVLSREGCKSGQERIFLADCHGKKNDYIPSTVFTCTNCRQQPFHNDAAGFARAVPTRQMNATMQIRVNN